MDQIIALRNKPGVMIKILLLVFIITGFVFYRLSAQTPETETKIVDFEADIMRPINIGDSSVLNLLGNVILHHNGAVITCDSAIRYNDKRMECFKRVIINKGTTYIYGDRAEYDGEINEARVYAPIIKMVDGDAVMYTYNFTFNTLDNIGTYSGGATMRQNDNLLESQRGYYYVDYREFVGVDEVEITNPDYMLMSDSVAYNLDYEIATFFVKSYIWNSKGEILSAEQGQYFHTSADYRFTSDAYILTDDQEIWADSIDYNSETENAILRQNVQIRDEEQKVLAFGDYGQYWGALENAMLTKDPSIVTFDPEQDSLYMRADSMFLHTYPYDYDFDESPEIADMPDMDFPSIGEPLGFDEDGNPIELPEVDDETDIGQDAIPEEGDPSEFDGLEGPQYDDETGMPPYLDGDPPLYLEGGDKFEPAREEAPDGSIPEGAVDVDGGILTEGIDEIPTADNEATEPETATADNKQTKSKEKESKSSKRKRERKERKSNTAQSATIEPGDGSWIDEMGNTVSPEHFPEEFPEGEIMLQIPEDQIAQIMDSLGLSRDEILELMSDSIAMQNLLYPDSLLQSALGSDSTLNAGLSHDSLEVQQPVDTIQRVVRGYRNVRIFRNDFQAVCDSIIGYSKDSTLHMYIDPVLWNEENQIVSDIVILYTKNQNLEKAVFQGSPFMSSEVDPLHYNQIKGKLMEAYFRDNDIYRHDVIGNGETYYYMQDDDTGDIMGFLVAECADISFLIEDKKMDKIIYRGNPVYTIYPMDKIPLDQDMFLPGFKWEANRRPTLRSVFNRTIRESEREAYESMESPDFPITERIHRDRENKIASGVWRERNDSLSTQALEFLRSLSYDE